MTTIGVVTVGRSDYGLYRPILRKIQSEPDLELSLFVSGMHLAPEFGLTLREIEHDGVPIAHRVEMLLGSDTPEAIAKSMGLGAIGFAQAYAHSLPDLLLVLGDRFEMHAAALAALPFKIPVAHIHGGEITEGAIDDPLRHSITKLSHLHFVSTEASARRVTQMGEEPWRVIVSGSPAIDAVHEVELLEPEELAARFGWDRCRPPLIVTFHPVTLEYEQTEWQMSELLEALRAFDVPMVFTAPNADTNGRIITRMIEAFVRDRPGVRFVPNLGTQAYLSLMAAGAAMVGNSSSGIIEAASFELPVVNIGSRQRGRTRAKNVIDVGYARAEIASAIQAALAAEFRASLEGITNPYGAGNAAEIIVKHLKELSLYPGLPIKRFVDWALPYDSAVSASLWS